MRKAFLPLWLALVVLTGCAASGTGTASDRPVRDRNVITSEEIADAERHSTAYEVVQSLRPAWLRARSSGSINAPGAGMAIVYMDGTRMGATAALRQINRTSVISMQYLDPSDATTRFGTGHTGGVILVTTRSSR
jgi:hypothetical protein